MKSKSNSTDLAIRIFSWGAICLSVLWVGFKFFMYLRFEELNFKGIHYPLVFLVVWFVLLARRNSLKKPGNDI
jgi:hypothetical protein